MNKRLLYTKSDICNELIDIKNIFSIHYFINTEHLYVNGMFLTSNQEQIDRFIEGYCIYHDFEIEDVRKVLFECE